MSYGGFMKVKNNWGEPISGYITHISSEYPYYTSDPTDYYSQVTINFNDLANGAETETQAITTEVSKFDLWVYSLTLQNGPLPNSSVSGSTECGFEEEDSGGTVLLVVDFVSGDLLIQNPQSSNCSTSIVT